MARYRGTYEHSGHKFRSKFELGLAKTLEGDKVKYDYEKDSYEYFTKVTNGVCEDCSGTCVTQRRWYTPDFFLPDGLIIEAKGHFTASNRTTLLAVRKSHPAIDLRIVFMADSKISRVSGTRCSDWCIQHDFTFAIRKIPKGWYGK